MENIRKIRVAEIVGNAQTGGVINVLLNYYRNMDRSKFEIDFFTYGPSKYDDEIRRLGGRIFHTANFIFFPKAMAQLSKFFKQNRYDVVHSHLTSLSVFPLFVAWQHKIPVRICHSHSTSAWGDKALVKNFLKLFCPTFATKLLACSNKSAKWCYGKRPCQIVHNAVDVERFAENGEKGDEVKNALDICGKVVGFVGRFVPQKNVGFLLSAFAKVKYDATLVLVGSGKQKDKLMKKAKKLGIEQKVVFVGEVDNPEDYYNAFDLFCLPSKYEGLPLVVVEARFCNVKCLVSDRVTDEVAVDGGVKLLPLDEQTWAREMENALAFGKIPCDKERLKENYDIKTQAQKLEEIYLDCCKDILQ